MFSGIEKERLSFKSGEKRIIENGPEVSDFKRRNIAQNVKTFISQGNNLYFQRKKYRSQRANIHFPSTENPSIERFSIDNG